MYKHLKLLSGTAAFVIYFIILAILINYFNHHSRKKPIHYVKKNENRISVAIASGTPKKESIKSKKTRKAKAKPKTKEKPKYKKTRKNKSESKKKRETEKKKTDKTKKEKKEHKKEKSKPKSNLKNLFGNIKEKKPPKEKKKVPKKDQRKKGKKNRDKGIENAYFAKVENVLQNWPAQSEFAGEKIKVWLRIKQDGSFTFKVLSASGNDLFNEELINYLKQLQKIGFGRHSNSKPYELNVEFIAKE